MNSLKSYGTELSIFDFWASPAEVLHEYDLTTSRELNQDKFDAIVLAVAHKEFLDLPLRKMLTDKGVIYDVKGILKDKADACL